MMHPTALRTSVLVQEVDRELVLYDTARHVAHRLNGFTARVWNECDGRASVAEIARRVSTEVEPVDEEMVHVALDALREAGLLTEAGVVTRRAALRRMAAVAGGVVAPLVVSIAAPTPADALSGRKGAGPNPPTPPKPPKKSKKPKSK